LTGAGVLGRREDVLSTGARHQVERVHQLLTQQHYSAAVTGISVNAEVGIGAGAGAGDMGE